MSVWLVVVHLLAGWWGSLDWFFVHTWPVLAWLGACAAAGTAVGLWFAKRAGLR